LSDLLVADISFRDTLQGMAAAFKSPIDNWFYIPSSDFIWRNAVRQLLHHASRQLHGSLGITTIQGGSYCRHRGLHS
jgi:hypothetical protein